MRNKLMLIIALLFAHVAMAETVTETFVYISLFGENKIKVFKINKTDHQLELVETISTVGKPYPLTMTSTKEVLIAGTWESSLGKLISYKIDGNTGKLTLIKKIDALGRPTTLDISNNDNHLLACSYMGNKVSSRTIAVDGTINSTPTINIDLMNNPHMIILDNEGDNALVPTINNDMINQYSFDQSTGNLTPLETSSISVVAGSGPRHMSFHPALGVVYMTNEYNTSVQVFNHTNTGLSAAIQTLTVSETAGIGSDLHVTPDGKFLYVAKKGEGSITGYSIDQSNGQLTLLDDYTAPTSVYDFAIDPSGAYLIAPGRDSGTAQLYIINTDGSLTPQSTTAVGSDARWVLTLDLDVELVIGGGGEGTGGEGTGGEGTGGEGTGSEGTGSEGTGSEGTGSEEEVPLSIKDDSAEIQAYPNPSYGIFSFELSIPIKNKDMIQVISLNGTSIETNPIISETNIRLDLSELPKGKYFIKIIQEGKVSINKLVKL